jgi:CheY-like chemotaxis protein
MICERLVLRAELSHAQREIVAHTTELTSDSVVVRTDELLAPGDAVALRLSLRQLLPPVQLAARVVARDPGAGFGYFPGVTLALDPPTGEQRALLVRLIGADAPERGEAPDAGEGRRGGEPPACRILVVEDSALMRDYVGVRAEQATDGSVRVIVDTADTVDRALELIEARSYALALIDLYLPGGPNGDSLVRTIRQRGFDQLAVIGCSVGGEPARVAFLDAGADLYLDKPVKVKDLFATVQRLTLLNARKGLV